MSLNNYIEMGQNKLMDQQKSVPSRSKNNNLNKSLQAYFPFLPSVYSISGKSSQTCLQNINNNNPNLKMERHQKRVYLDINYAFGSNFYLNLKNSLSFIDEDDKLKIVYTAGKTIVKKSLDSEQMQFIKLSDNIEFIQCMAISPTRNHAAICQKIRNQNFILLNLYGLKSRDSQIKHFKLPQTEKQSTFKIIAFAPSQPKYACCLTGDPQNQLIFLDISRSRGLAVSNFPVIGASSLNISPSQSHIISVCGKGFFKLYKVQDYSFKPLQEVKKLPKNRTYTTHCWFDKTKILVGTDRGELFMVGPIGNNYQVKRNFSNVFNEENEVSISEIGILSKGFILGSEQGHFSLWIKKQETEENFQDQYAGQLVRTWKSPHELSSEVVAIAICSKQQNIAVGFKNNSIALMKISSILAEKEEHVQDHELFETIHSGFHKGPINSMDICLHRPIIATLSKAQKCIRLWNYKHPKSQLIKRFDGKIEGIQQTNTTDLLSCLALHPFGYYLAVGFYDKLRVYHILISDLRNYKEIVLRGVCQLKFSNGGHLLAAAFSKQKYNIHLINVYNSYTLQEVARLSDHSNVITDLYWRPDDKALYSTGADGFVVEWKYQAKVDNKEWICRKWSQQNSKYTSGIFEKYSKSFLVSGQEGGKNIIRELRLEKEQAQKIYTMGFRVNKLQWLNSQWNIPAIVGGTQEGAIKIFNSPFDNIVQQTINVHFKQVSRIQTSPCGRYVVSVGQDNNIFIFQVSLTNREGFISKRLHDQVNEYELNPLIGVMDEELSDIILIQRNSVNQKIRYIKLLEKNLDEMRNKIVIQDEETDKKHKNQFSKVQSLLNEKVEELSSKFQQLKKQKKELEIRTQNNFTDTQAQNSKMLEQIEVLYEKKLTLENQRYFQIEKEFEKLKEHNQDEILKLERDIKNSLNQLKNDFIETFKRAEKVHVSKQNEVIESQKAYNEKLNQIEEQHEEQLKRVNKKINEVIKQKQLKTAQLLTNIQSFNRQIKMLREEIVDYMLKNQRLEKYLAECRKDYHSIIKQIEDRSRSLLEKQQQMKVREEKINQFQQRIADLQKKKHILGYRTWEMRQEVEPKEDEIQFLKQSLFDLETQFENLLKDERNMKETQGLIIKDKQKLQKKIRQLKTGLKEKEAKIKKICEQITEIVQAKTTDRKFQQERINVLYQKYSHLMTNNTRINYNTKGNQQMARHIDHLKSEIVDVNDKTNQGMAKRDEQLRRATIDNKNLIKELSDLRITKKELSDELKNLAKIADNLKRQIHQIKNGTVRGSSPFKTMISKKPSSKQIPTLPSLNKGQLLRSASGPSIKGKLVRGNNFDGQKLINMTKAKVGQMQDKLDKSKNELRQKEISVQMIKSLIKEHIKEQSCSDQYLQRCLTQYQL